MMKVDGFVKVTGCELRNVMEVMLSQGTKQADGFDK